MVTSLRAVLPLFWLVPLGLAAGSPGGWSWGVEASADAAAVLEGGQEQGQSLNALALGHVGWDSGAQQGETPPTWSAYASVLGLTGQGPTARWVGDFHGLSNSAAEAGVRLYAWWGQYEAGSTSLRAGALLADEEFTGTEAGGYLINSGFGWPSFISGNTVNTGPAFFIPALGVRVRQDLPAGLSLQTGLFDGDSWDSPEGDARVNEGGWRYALNEGLYSQTEVSWAPAERGTAVKVGFWYHSGDFSDLYRDGAGGSWTLSGLEPRTHGSTHGTYAIVEQRWPAPAGAAGEMVAHLRAGWAPENRAPVARAWDAAWAWTGFSPARPDDALAFGYLRSTFSDAAQAQALDADPSSLPVDFEEVWELSYTAPVSPHLTVQPDLQFIRHPGGSAALPDAWVFLVRFSAQF